MMGVPTGGIVSRSIQSAAGLFDGVQDQKEYEELVAAGKKIKTEAAGVIKPASRLTPPQQIDAFRQEYGSILHELGKPLMVMIDNLDRCLPTNAIHTLEAIRLFLFLPNTAFVIAADEEIVRLSVSEYFKNSSARHQMDYLDKLIQVPIRVPKAGVREIRAYIFILVAIDFGVKDEQLEHLREELEKSLQNSWNEDQISKENVLKLTGKANNVELARAYDMADRIAPLLARSPFIHGNPRTVKRLLNVVKMRAQIAKRRNIPFDESLITKLVIFERCAGEDATADLYKLIDIESGKPKLLAQLEDAKDGELPPNAPDSWSKNQIVQEFILEWGRLEPPLKNKDLRAAIYLSRETVPIGAYSTELSLAGRSALKVLLATGKISSLEGADACRRIPLRDQVPAIEAVIDHLRQVTEWNIQPIGFAGACLLASQSPETGRLLCRFISTLGKQPPWMKVMLKEAHWYKEEK